MDIFSNNIEYFFLLKAMTFRKEDYDVNRPQSEMEDILQYNNKPRTTMYRGVQLPAGFMATAGGIDHVSKPLN